MIVWIQMKNGEKRQYRVPDVLCHQQAVKETLKMLPDAVRGMSLVKPGFTIQEVGNARA